MTRYRTRDQIEDDLLENMIWDQSEGAYRAVGPVEWETDMHGVYVKDGAIYVDGDVVSETIAAALKE